MLWQLKSVWCKFVCWFVGHDVISGDRTMYEDDWCDRCFMDWPQDKVTLPILLNRVYCWAVDHGWPESIDLWFHKHFRMPRWWEY